MTGTNVPPPESAMEKAERERLDRERQEGKRRAAAMADAATIEKLIHAAHNELAKRGEHAGPFEVATFLVANGLRAPKGALERITIPETWPKMGLGERVEDQP